LYAKNIILSFNDIGKKPPSFGDASKIAQTILEADVKFDNATMFFNVFK
jgi:F-type H+-transporting ATPase subunit gamma